MSIKKHMLAFVLACGLLSVSAQVTESAGKAEPSPFPGLIIKFSPLAMIEIPQPAFQLALEYPVSPLLSLQHELGWMPPMGSSGLFENGTKQQGFKVKSEVRYFLPEPEAGGFKPRRTYFAFEGMYRMRAVRNERWHQINNGTFSQWLVTEQYRQQAAFHFKYGRMVMLSPTGKIIIDSYVGLGLRRFFADTRQLTKELQGDPQLSGSNYDFVIPSLTLGFKIGIGVK